MATILKWWKMKMLGGYKTMPGVSNDSDCGHSALVDSGSSPCCRGHRCASSTDETRIYDTDEEDGFSVVSGATPRHETPPMTPRRSGSPRADGRSPKDEFNFTLYDFDGHGKVTKDDIAGLVRAIYEVVGSSVQVPPSGSKTINVKLTVTPERQREAAAAAAGAAAAGAAGVSAAAAGQQRDLSITIRSSDGGRGRSKDDLDLRPEAPRPRFNSMRGAQPPAWRTKSPCGLGVGSGGVGGGGVGAGDTSPPLPRRQLPTDPVRHRHLVELLQTSMEKNNLKFNNLRRHNSEREAVRQRGVNRGRPEVTAEPAAGCAHATPCSLCVRERWAKRHAGCRARRCQPPAQHREYEDDYELLARCAEFALRGAGGGGAQDPRPRPARRDAAPRPAGGSPHHQMKHKNRERDHYRAMQQVLNWLEREHSGPPPTAHAHAEPQTCHCEEEAPPPPQPPPPQPQPPPQPTKVEHHHMHEHVHHHYHHFPKDAVIL